MRRNRNTSTIISGGPAFELISIADRFVYRRPLDRNEAVHFEEIDENLLQYALDAKNISETTALHKVLTDLVYIEFYLYLYDDMDSWDGELNCFKEYAMHMFNHMNIVAPEEFYATSSNELDEARRKYSDLFLLGLQSIVTSAFANLWHRKAFLYDFNTRLAEKIRPLLKENYPVLEQDGRLPRVPYFNKWISDLIVNREAGLCHYCHCSVATPALSNQIYEIDHMVPIALGGTNDPTNLVLSCPKCNNDKRAKIQSIPDTFSWPKRT